MAVEMPSMKKSGAVARAAAVVEAESERELTDRERRFVENYAVLQMSVFKAAVAAGYSPNMQHHNILNKSVVQSAVKEARAENARRLNMTRDRILAGMLDAVERAVLLSEPMTEIAGWREIAKVSGFYEKPEKPKELSQAMRRVVERFENMTEEQLASVMAEPVGDIIDGATGETEH